MSHVWGGWNDPSTTAADAPKGAMLFLGLVVISGDGFLVSILPTILSIDNKEYTARGLEWATTPLPARLGACARPGPGYPAGVRSRPGSRVGGQGF